MAVYPEGKKIKHECLKAVHLDADQEEIYNKVLSDYYFTQERIKNEEAYFCTCNNLTLLLKRERNILSDPLILKLFESLQFRGILGILNIQLYEHLNKPRYKQRGIVMYGLQTFCSYKVSCRIMQSDFLLNTWIDFVDKETTEFLTSENPNVDWLHHLSMD